MDRKKIWLQVLSIAAAVSVFFAVRLFLPSDRACQRIQAKLGLVEEFCQGLAERAAEERCQTLADDPQTMGQCLRVIVPAAHSGCLDYVNVQRIENQSKELCD